ncbi:MAG: fibronectin type III domain-containing protein [Bacteroidota bacterium]
MKIRIFAFTFFLSIFSFQVFSQIFPASLIGHWTFDNTSNLTQASLGNDLVLTGSHTVVPGPVAGDTAVAIGPGSYYTCTHGISANGGGTLVNEYSIMFDFMIADPMIWHCFYQTNTSNSNDGEVFINTSGNIGVSSTGYSGFSVQPNTWHRLVVAVDLGTSFKYFIDGQLVLNGTSQILDGRFSLDIPDVLFFADDNGEDNLINISQIALFNAPLTDNEVLQMGGLDSTSIKPYLQTPTPNSMYISWNSYNSLSTVVEYGTTPSLGNLTSGSYENISTNRWHTVKLTGLQPGTRYYYRCISGTDTSAIYPFRTPTDYGDTSGHVRFAVIGDSQTNVETSSSIADTILSTFINLYGVNWYDSVSMVVHSGDIIGDGTNIGSYLSEYFIPFSKISCSVPFLISIGNHVVESNYFYSFVKYEDFSDYATSNPLCEKYYSFYLGDCQFIALNTNGIYNNFIQTDWLNQKLTESDANNLCDFVFSFSHHPGKSEIWPDGNTSYVWNDVYGELKGFPKIAMHSTGHSHDYERGVIRTTHSQNWDFRTILSGGAGGDLDRWGMYANQTDYSEIQLSLDYYNYVLVDVDMNQKRCDTKMYSLGNPEKPMNNSIIDQWHCIINQPSPVKPTAISPVSLSGLTPQLVGSAFSGVDSLMSSEIQLTGKYSTWDSPLINTLRDSENIYGVTGPPDYNPVNLNSGINLQLFDVPTGILLPDSSYKWRIRYRDHNVRWSEWSDSAVFVALSTHIDEYSDEFSFLANPNPFSKKVNINFSTKVSENIRVSIFDLNGKLIKTLADNIFDIGEQQLFWDGKDVSGKKVLSGMYFCSIKSKTLDKTVKLIYENK